ncbi:MAG: hypothetical protein EAZ52_05325 [Alphaproteobacteria bacterium]|nr:MAG: hypothetical protein EAZ52_05325 [Alphaproteobacteria bacterium]
MNDLSTNTAAQRSRLFHALKERGVLGVTSLEARTLLDILHPAGRIKELRKQGIDIVTAWTWQPTERGKLHRVGRYVLLGSFSPINNEAHHDPIQ